MPDSISNIMNTVVYWNTIWMIVLSILIFVILYFVVDLFLKKLDSLDKEESEKKWIQYYHMHRRTALHHPVRQRSGIS